MTSPERSVRVLLVSAMAPPSVALASSVPQLVALGAHVELAALRRPTLPAGLQLDTWRVRPGVSPRPGRLSPRRVQRAWRTRVIGRLATRCKPPLAAWLLCSHDPRVIASVREADILVALDRYAVYTVWRFARRDRRLGAVHGLTEAVLRCQPAHSAAGHCGAGPGCS